MVEHKCHEFDSHLGSFKKGGVFLNQLETFISSLPFDPKMYLVVLIIVLVFLILAKTAMKLVFKVSILAVVVFALVHFTGGI